MYPDRLPPQPPPRISAPISPVSQSTPCSGDFRPASTDFARISLYSLPQLRKLGYLSSAKLSAKQFAAAVRTHWHVENRLHWVMDVVFHDDLMRLRTRNGPANMAAVRHMSLNLIRQIDDKASLKVRRKTIAWDDDYLFAALAAPPK
jgi:Transposase DDE domain